MKASIWIWAAAFTLLAGCATTTPPRNPENQKAAEQQWAQRRASVSQIDRFLMTSRLAYGKVLGVKADLRWQQNADGSFDMRISGPFGVGAATLTGNRQHVLVRTRDGDYDTPDPEAWLRENMGWTLPLNSLRYWALGLPAPQSEATIELDIKGKAVVLEQDGWRLEYSEYQSKEDYELPRKFEATNPTVRLKVVVDDWSDLPTLQHK
jgi:outer membrane lipoprotein LolB